MASDHQITVKATEAKLHFGEMLNECLYGDKEVIIEKHDKPVAVMVSLKKWHNKQAGPQNQEPSLWNEIQTLRESVKKYQAKRKIKSKKTAVDYIRQLRDER